MYSSSAKLASTASDQRLAAIVSVLDQQLLAAADETLEESEKAELLAWAHQHLMAPVIDLQQRAREPGDTNKNHCDEGARFSLDCIDIIHWLLTGDAVVSQGLKFRGVKPFPKKVT